LNGSEKEQNILMKKKLNTKISNTLIKTGMMAALSITVEATY
jgi:hypothetical protein